MEANFSDEHSNIHCHNTRILQQLLRFISMSDKKQHADQAQQQHNLANINVESICIVEQHFPSA